MKLSHSIAMGAGLISCLTLACLIPVGAARADTTFSGLASLETYGINADFEDPALAHSDTAEATTQANIGPGWNVRVIDGTSSNYGVADPNQTFYPFQSAGGPLTAPFEGRQYGFVNLDSGATADTLSKSLGTIKAGQSYSLNVAVGVRGGSNYGLVYEIGLQTLAGADVGTLANTGILNTPGAMQDMTYSLSSAAAAPFVGQEVAIVIRGHNVQPTGAFSQENFDNVRLNGTFGDAVFPILTIDRSTGNISLSKTGPSLNGFNGYELTSADGAFNSSNWLSISDNYDNGGSVDSDNQWTELSASGSKLAEAEINLPAGNGGTIAGPINLGNAWVRTPYEDVVGKVLTTDGVERTVQVQYTGTPIPVGDLNGDAMINVADWTLFKSGQGSNFSGLTRVGAYLKGDLNSDFQHDLRDFIAFRAAFDAANGAGAFLALTGVPEPGTVMLSLVAAVCAVVLPRLSRPQMVPRHLVRSVLICVAAFAVLAWANTASAGRKVDRLYHFGDDSAEGNTAPGQTVGQAPGNTNPGFTLDSIGPAGQFEDLQVTGGPTYANVASGSLARPGTQAGELGASFNGAGDALHTQNGASFPGGFNNPALSNSSTLHDPPGTTDWTSIVNRGFQLWAYPSGPNTAANVQHVVHDTDEHGFRVSAAGNWEMRYNSTTFTSSVPVTFGQWHHVMSVIPHGTGGLAAANNTDGEVLYVDGVAVAAIGGGYDLTTTTEVPNGGFQVGSNLAGTDNYFNGTLDELEVFGWGRTALGTDYGQFDLAQDNWFVADYLNGFALGDINRSGGAINQADISAFIAGYGSEKVINDVRVGDITTYAKGDLNFDGVTDLTDVRLMLDALPGAGSGAGLDRSALVALAGAVPEPGTLALAALGFAFALSSPRKRGQNDFSAVP